MPKDPYVFFEDMLDSIVKIQKYTAYTSFEEFSEDEMRIDAVLRNLEVIGEAASNIPSEIRSKYPNIQWKKIVGLRNILIHEYFGVDMVIVWDIVENYLDALKNDVQVALGECENK